MVLLERMMECVTGTAFISRSETAAVASNGPVSKITEGNAGKVTVHRRKVTIIEI
jgi:hypothetical protein